MTDCKVITFEIEYEVYRRNCIVKVFRKAELNFDWHTKLNSIFKFMQDLHPVLNSYKRCAKNDCHCRVELSVGRYTQNTEGQVVTESFDHWVFDDVADDETGISFSADEKYTAPDRSFWLDLTCPLSHVLSELSI